MTGKLWNSLPISASDLANDWDALYIFLLVLSVVFFVVVIGLMVYFAWKYRAGHAAERAPLHGNVPLEIAWTVIPTILLLVLFFWGWNVYREMITVPADAYEVKVIGKQWQWQFIYEDGRATTNEVYVPLNKPVRFIMTSDDVLHSFFIPNFRVKQDVVPGMYSSVWFQATIAGEHQVFCAEYCGGDHSRMLAKVKVLDDAQWHEWMRGREVTTVRVGLGMDMVKPVIAGSDGKAPKLTDLAKKGESLAASKGCVACHSFDGSTKVGPSWKGIYGHEVEFADGTKGTVDDNYIRQSIDEPNAKVVKGFAPSMTSFKGQLTDPEYFALIAFIKALK